ncbi:hypothetical protein ACQ4PT_055251 [Festuca glaucescens]
MAATTAQQPASAFTFLKHGVLLPASRCGLFFQLVAVATVLSMALHLFKFHTLQPLAPAVANLWANFCRRDVEAEALATLVENFLADQGWLLLLGAAYLVADIALAFAIQTATVSAAVAAFSGEHHTFLSFPRKAKGNTTGPFVTVALGCLLKAAFVGAIILYYAAAFSHQHSPRVLSCHAMLGVIAVLFYLFLDVVCAVAIVASVAEPGLRGTGAMGRAWRLVSDGEVQAALYVTGTLLLDRAVSEVCILAVALLPRTAATVIAYYLMLGAAQVFSAAAVTAYYFECSKRNVEDQKARHTE